MRENVTKQNIGDQIVAFRNAIYNITLASPLTEEGKDRLTALQVGTIIEYPNKKGVLTEEEFCKNWFVDADFSADDEASSPEIGSLWSHGEKTMKEADKKGFEAAIREMNSSFFTIMGSARSGKTTYMYHLKYELSASHVFHVSDFEKTERTFDIYRVGAWNEENGNVRTEISEPLFVNNLWKFYCVILEQLIHILFEYHVQLGESQEEYLAKVTKEYGDSFGSLSNELGEIMPFFSKLDKMPKNKPYELAFAVEKILPHHDKNQDMHAAKKALNILERLLFCLSRIDGKKHLFVIDNIEQFVLCDAIHPIQYGQLKAIFQIVKDVQDEIRPSVNTIISRIKNYQSSFGVLLVTRSATNEHNEVVRPLQRGFLRAGQNVVVCVSINGWFPPEKVFNTKITKFADMDIRLPESALSTAFKYIMSDSFDTAWSLYPLLQRFFDNSLDRTYINLAEALIGAIINYSGDLSELEHFNERWVATHEEGESDRAKINFYFYQEKHLLRQYIIRLLFDHIQKTDFITKIMLEVGSDPPSADALKILTLLHFWGYEVLGNEKNRYITFRRLVYQLLKKPHRNEKNLGPDNYRKLAEILYSMNETRESYANWTNLICIRWPADEEYGENSIREALESEYKDWYEGGRDLGRLDSGICDAKYAVRITRPGSFLAGYMAQYEYFACRLYSKQMKSYSASDCFCTPLFSPASYRKRIIDGKPTCNFLKALDKVYKKADSCCQIVVLSEEDFWKTTDPDDRAIDIKRIRNGYTYYYYRETHPERIVRAHKEYLTRYVKPYITDAAFLEDDLYCDRALLLEEINNTVVKYTLMLANLKKNHPCFFEAKLK